MHTEAPYSHELSSASSGVQIRYLLSRSRWGEGGGARHAHMDACVGSSGYFFVHVWRLQEPFSYGVHMCEPRLSPVSSD